MQEFDNYNPDSNEIKDIYAEEIDRELAYHFPVEESMEKQFYELINKKTSKKDIIKNVMSQIDEALDEGNREKFYRLSKMYRHIQKEFRYY